MKRILKIGTTEIEITKVVEIDVSEKTFIYLDKIKEGWRLCYTKGSLPQDLKDVEVIEIVREDKSTAQKSSPDDDHRTGSADYNAFTNTTAQEEEPCPKCGSTNWDFDVYHHNPMGNCKECHHQWKLVGSKK